MRITMLAAVPLLAVTACHSSADTAAEPDKSVHIAMDNSGGKDQVSVDIPGFAAKLALPALDLGKHVDLDGIKVAPDTTVGDLDIVGQGHGGNDGSGQVRLSFTNPQAPAALANYYRRSAMDAGYDKVVVTGGTVTAMKGDKQFALFASPQGSGSRGTITMSGGG